MEVNSVETYLKSITPCRVGIFSLQQLVDYYNSYEQKGKSPIAQRQGFFPESKLPMAFAEKDIYISFSKSTGQWGFEGEESPENKWICCLYANTGFTYWFYEGEKPTIGDAVCGVVDFINMYRCSDFVTLLNRLRTTYEVNLNKANLDLTEWYMEKANELKDIFETIFDFRIDSHWIDFSHDVWNLN